MLESNQENKFQQTVKSVYLGIDRNTVKFQDTDNDFRYYFDSVPKKPFFPAPLCKFKYFFSMLLLFLQKQLTTSQN